MNVIEQIRNSIKVMRKFKADNRMVCGVKACVAEDVFADLKNAHAMTRDAVGKYLLDGVPVFELKDYPRGYISVE